MSSPMRMRPVRLSRAGSDRRAFVNRETSPRRRAGTGHKTEAVYRRYAITSEADLRERVERLNGLPTKDPRQDRLDRELEIESFDLLANLSQPSDGRPVFGLRPGLWSSSHELVERT